MSFIFQARRALTVAAVAAVMGLGSMPASAVISTTPFSGLFVFGDSLSDPGNLAVYVPPNPGQVISGNSYIPNQPYASAQFTNGDVWAKSFASMLGLPGAGGPYLLPGGGSNYAFGGARTSTGSFPPSLVNQVGGYLTATGNTASSSALYVVAGGGNDGRDAVQAAAAAAAAAAVGGPAAAEAAAAAVIGAAAVQYATNTLGMVNSLRAAGASNIIVWNVPNLGLAPAITALGSSASTLGTQVSFAMNAQMEFALAQVTAVAPGVKLFNDFNILTQAVANPGAFGLSNVTDACGDTTKACNLSLSTSLFWDGIHPTAAGHSVLAQQMYTLAVPEPATLLMMAVGVLLLLAIGRRRQA